MKTFEKNIENVKNINLCVIIFKLQYRRLKLIYDTFKKFD